jgi:hypothetical protein
MRLADENSVPDAQVGDVVLMALAESTPAQGAVALAQATEDETAFLGGRVQGWVADAREPLVPDGESASSLVESPNL